MKAYTIFRGLVRLRKLRRLKWLWLSLLIGGVLCYGALEGWQRYDHEFAVADELPYYHVKPRPADDTLRVVIIGDSWAEWHVTLGCDSLIQKYAHRVTEEPLKCVTRGKSGAKTKDVYHFMFTSQTKEVTWDHDYCTQPLLEEHPDYCVIMVGINDCWKKRPLSYYTGNYRLILRLLLANGIRPVVMEIPDFDLTGWIDLHSIKIKYPYRFFSLLFGIWDDDIDVFRNALKDMLRETGLSDSVLYIPQDHWLPKNHNFTEDIYQQDHVHLNLDGLHVLDSCIITDIIADWEKRNRNTRP